MMNSNDYFFLLKKSKIVLLSFKRAKLGKTIQLGHLKTMKSFKFF